MTTPGSFAGFLAYDPVRRNEQRMKSLNFTILIVTAGLSLFPWLAPQSLAAEKAPFYQGKMLTFIINFDAGV
jgi:hypothetical protein